jgi:DNA-binding CsgD family transcriptional regulator
MEMETFNTVPTLLSTSQKTENFFRLLTDLLIQEVSEPFFQNLLDLTVSEIFTAQAGSVMVLQGKRYHFVATNGYNLQELQKVTLSLEESILRAEPCQNSFLLRNLDRFNQENLDLERFRVLQKTGRVGEIKETLLIPIRQEGQIIATLSLDSFSNSASFTKPEIKAGERLGTLLGLALKFHGYQEQISSHQTSVKSKKTQAILDTALCPRDEDVLECIIEGLSNKKIAGKLGLSDTTTRNYVARLFRKLGVHSRTQAVRWASEYNTLIERR